jgi:1-deoxy-D-xylulose-5-phosphate synthase
MDSKILDKINEVSDIKSLNNMQLRELATEIRQMIIDVVSKNGGHLASNLGVVEIPIALHRIFDSPKDKIVFDVGHQCYAHKILTDRKHVFHTIRQEEGISGFPKRDESAHDTFNTGHSSTAISAAIGMARARDLAGEKNNVVALIGDGALTGGMVWEALNDAGQSGEKIVIVLNDNEMSIGKNVGAISTHLSNLRSARGYINLKGIVSSALKSIPLIGKSLKDFVESVKKVVKYTFLPNIMFEQLGFRYYGIVDGHDIEDLEKIFEHVKHIDEPVIIHVKTQKGRGAEYSSTSPELYHSTCPFDAKTGVKKKSNYKIPNKIVEHLIELADKICAITAAMEHGCGLVEFQKHFPDRFFDVGIAEQHAVTMCAGMAVSGCKPVFFVYSSFLQRAYDQILHDMCMQDVGATIVVYNTGVVGDDGETHHGIFDVSFLRHIPNLHLYSPSSIEEAYNMMDRAIDSSKPTIILLPKTMPKITLAPSDSSLSWTKFTMADKPKIAIFASGSILVNAMDAIRNYELYRYVDVYNSRSIKPIDKETIKNVAKSYKKIVTIEDNLIQAGFGSAVLEVLQETDFKANNLIRLGYEDRYVGHGKITSLHKKAGIDTLSIAKKLKELLQDE